MKKELFKYPKGQREISESFYNEIFTEHEYDRYGAKVEAGDVVIDCGAFIGHFTHFALTKGAKHVYSFEANEEHYNYLIENTKFVPQVDATLGMVSDIQDGGRLWNLERIMKHNNLQYVDYLKMDIEGSEFAALINMEDELLRRVNKWAIELHPKWDEGNSTSKIKWHHGVDFSGHTASKILYIMEKFTKNGFKIGYEHVHKDYDIAMLYVWK